MSGSEVAGLVRYDDASLDGLRSLSAMAESEDYASAGRASGGEKLAGWEIKAPRKCAMVLRQHNSQNLLLCWAAPEFGLRRRGHSPLLMAFGRGGKTAMVVGGSIRDKPSSLSIRFTPRCSSTPRPSQAAISSSVLLIFSFRVWGHSWEGEKGRRAIAVPRPFAL